MFKKSGNETGTIEFMDLYPVWTQSIQKPPMLGRSIPIVYADIHCQTRLD